MADVIWRTAYDRYSKLAYRWAPIHYQHVNKSYIERDLICAVDYDGNWNTADNKGNIYDHPLVPVAYYGIAETGTHYYILYCFYHADDRDHENDLEGCLLVVRKEDEGLLGMITVAHWDFYSYVVEERLKKGRETLDGKLQLKDFNGEMHPVTRQEKDKHGFYAWNGAPWWMFWERDSEFSKGIRYVPGDKAAMPDLKEIGSFRSTPECNYILIDIAGPDGLWKRKDDPRTFKSWGIFNSKRAGSANAPWVWDDFTWYWDDKQYFWKRIAKFLGLWKPSPDFELSAGTIFYDPARLVLKYFDGFGEFDKNYNKLMWEER